MNMKQILAELHNGITITSDGKVMRGEQEVENAILKYAYYLAVAKDLSEELETLNLEYLAALFSGNEATGEVLESEISQTSNDRTVVVDELEKLNSTVIPFLDSIDKTMESKQRDINKDQALESFDLKISDSDNLQSPRLRR